PSADIFTPMTTVDKKTLHAWLHHWRDEADAAYLYGVLAGVERRQANHDVFLKLQAIERRHTELWAKLLAEHGHPVPSDAAKPSLNARFMAWLGRRFGPRYLLPLLLREEGREVKGYMELHRQSSTDDARSVSLTLARESAAHAETLANLAGRASEPWHRPPNGGRGDARLAARARRAGARGAEDRRGARHSVQGGLAHRSGHGRWGAHPRGAVPGAQRPHGRVDGVYRGDGLALRGRGRAQLLHRPRRDPQRDRHVRRGPGGGGRRVSRRRPG